MRVWLKEPFVKEKKNYIIISKVKSHQNTCLFKRFYDVLKVYEV